MVQCCLNAFEITLLNWKLYAMLPEKLQTILHKEKSCALLPSYFWDNIVQVKNLCSAVREAPDNIA